MYKGPEQTGHLSAKAQSKRQEQTREKGQAMIKGHVQRPRKKKGRRLREKGQLKKLRAKRGQVCTLEKGAGVGAQWRGRANKNKIVTRHCYFAAGAEGRSMMSGA